MITANQQDYCKSFQKHYHAYKNWGNAGSINSKRLILVYCVECGLKYLLMKKIRIQLVCDAQEGIACQLRSHDFDELIKSLNQAGAFRFPPIQTIHRERVRPSEYHQLCRYCVCPIDKDKNKLNIYDRQLKEIAEWIEERLEK